MRDVYEASGSTLERLFELAEIGNQTPQERESE